MSLDFTDDKSTLVRVMSWCYKENSMENNAFHMQSFLILQLYDNSSGAIRNIMFEFFASGVE